MKIKFLAFTSLFLLSSCTLSPAPRKLTIAPAPAPTSKQYTTEAELVAVGDILMHMALTRSGYNAQTKTYNFDRFFTETKSIISSGNWAIANLETTLAGSELGYSEFPLFNAPAPIVDAAKKAGFNILTTANNHALDKGEIGVLNTIKNIRSRGVASTGTASSPQEAQKILIVTKNQISMAILAYSFSTNGIPIPQGKNYLVSLIDKAKILKDIARAKQQGADVVAIALHFGEEYQRHPTDEQKQLVKTLIQGGADIILGSHPHVVQPYQILNVVGRDGKPRKGVVIYSMGNFIAYQLGHYKDLGVIFKVKLRKQFPEETLTITKVEAIPTYTQNYTLNGKLNFRVLPIAATLSRPKDPLIPASKYPVLKEQLTDMNRHLNSLRGSR
ncbi:CapA family protein [Oscillatoria sp. FACHB-1406]|uniref:CapA family protein n=1 Tax=Oscillatoria sp. FACHB-1406 TaxID=2692846 RepID=UPI001684C0A5|nr:CapA family protein [Oscillatoria sp. FACHB-1406]MBD2578115.1 CapA family protein [Oscillatoria sp. FACHB-1406]